MTGSAQGIVVEIVAGIVVKMSLFSASNSHSCTLPVNEQFGEVGLSFKESNIRGSVRLLCH